MRRLTEILAGEAQNIAGTKIVDLNLTDLVSRITVSMKGTNSTGVPTAVSAKMIQKIEVCDGSDVICSLTGVEAQALNAYEMGELPANENIYINDVMTIATFHINFGRFLWDKELALNPTKFNNLQIKITHNKALGGASPDAGTLAVFAHVMDQSDAKPTGFLMAKEIQSYALTSSAHEYITLPLDYSYRKMIILSLSAGKQPFDQFNKIKLSLDNDKQVLINNMSTSDIIKIYPHPLLSEGLLGTGTGSAETTYCTPSMAGIASVASLTSALTAGTILTQIFGGSFTALVDSGDTFQALICGKCPHGSIQIPFGDSNDTATWLDVSTAGVLKLDITAGSAVGSGSTTEIVIQQLRKY